MEKPLLCEACIHQVTALGHDQVILAAYKNDRFALANAVTAAFGGRRCAHQKA